MEYLVGLLLGGLNVFMHKELLRTVPGTQEALVNCYYCSLASPLLSLPEAPLSSLPRSDGPRIMWKAGRMAAQTAGLRPLCLQSTEWQSINI